VGGATKVQQLTHQNNYLISTDRNNCFKNQKWYAYCREKKGKLYFMEGGKSGIISGAAVLIQQKYVWLNGKNCDGWPFITGFNSLQCFICNFTFIVCYQNL